MHGHPRHRALSPLAFALLAAASLHGALWWAWPRDGVTGSHAEGAIALGPSVGDRAEHRVQLLLRSGPPIVSAAHAGDATRLVSGESDAPQPEPEHAHELAGANAWLASSYLDASELDQAPRPVADWYLDEEALQALPHALVLLRLKVSAQGRIDHVEVVRAEPPGEWVLIALRPLRQTPMQAGLLDGKPVASTFVIELATENERVR